VTHWTLWLVVLAAVVASGCRDACISAEIRHGDKCVLRPDTGVPDDGSGTGDAGLDSRDATVEDRDDDETNPAMDDAGFASTDSMTMIDAAACASVDGGAAECGCPAAFYADGTTCQRGALDVAPGETAHAIRTDGSLWQWGTAAGGSVPKRLGIATGWQQLGYGVGIDGEWHACAIRQGELHCWGGNSEDQLGLGLSAPDKVELPARVGADSDWAAVSLNHAPTGGYTCGIRQGMLFCWGSNDARWGLLGVGAAGESVHTPTRVGDRSDWTAISAGIMSACGIAGGELLCWTGAGRPTQLTEWTDWTQVASGAGHTCAVRSGQLYCWGNNDAGEVGIGDVHIGEAVPLPARVGARDDWESVSTGWSATCAIRAGELYCWGISLLPELVQIAETRSGSGRHEFAPTRVGDGSDWEQVRVGSGRACGRRRSGRVECWGANVSGELGIGAIARAVSCAPKQVGTDKDWASIAAGHGYSCGIRARELYCWGRLLLLSASGPEYHAPPSYSPSRIGTDSEWQMVSLHPYEAPGGHACGIRAGQLYCWGESSSGQLGTGDADLELDPRAPIQVGASSWTEVSVGSGATCARAAGNLFCWGRSPLTDATPPQPTPQPVAQDNWSAVGTGAALGAIPDENCGVRLGRLWCWSGVGPNRMLREIAGPGGEWSSISTGAASHRCGVSGTGVYCWGDNKTGQLGIGAAGIGVHQPLPVRVEGEAGTWLSLSTAEGRTCGIRTDWRNPAHGSLWCWGSREWLGLGGCEPGIVTEPVQIPGTWSAVALGTRHTCALAADGGLWCWGGHDYGESGHGPYWSSEPVPVEWPSEQ
jgi:alpha-tubulin suppressor-like RCC1 family protein